MSPTEVGRRAVHQARKRAWRSRQVRPGQVDTAPVPATVARFADLLTPPPAEPSPAAVSALLAVADGLLEGRWPVLGVVRTDAADLDWFLDPVTGNRAPQDTYAFAVDYRRAERTGIVKNVWEPSRHHQLTVLAAAHYLTGRDEYAAAAARQLRSWWDANPFLSGIHWTSGIELGIRLVSWAWIRRLLDGWSGAVALFEENPVALRQLEHHQEYLAAFLSTGSSANNHLIAEAAGLAVAGVAFPWFPSSPELAATGMDVLLRELDRQTDADGLNRELASEYHGLVLELALAAAAEVALAGGQVAPALNDVIVRMIDGLAAVVDVGLEPPRQGDGDSGFGLLLDDPERNRWGSLLAVGSATFGAAPWWPEVPAPDVLASILSVVLRRHLVPVAPRPPSRPTMFAAAGMTILRADVAGSELWCRLDAGPHGYLSIAAHAHADALSIELRIDGTDVLADPGTYCYHGDDAARSYFRSTLGHNTLELGGHDQSASGGPFLWTRHANSQLLACAGAEAGDTAVWVGEHDGYERRHPAATHRRSVVLGRQAGTLTVVDEVDAKEATAWRLAWHLGPAVRCRLESYRAHLTWAGEHGERSATIELSPHLWWARHEGDLDPPLGWYSPSFGVRQPSVTLVGSGLVQPGAEVATVLHFEPSL
jgi:hypothetical protein